ncbi:trypsin-like peptidase domain-containing protein [Nocardiopsis sediminis]|uniref:Trypsin-like peptidase domain-containing protein n=1 Tax=Nocardiopsis sediminis TaxID=1778267 RepID=A0ABV8FYN5_9ACTN
MSAPDSPHGDPADGTGARRPDDVPGDAAGQSASSDPRYVDPVYPERDTGGPAYGEPSGPADTTLWSTRSAGAASGPEGTPEPPAPGTPGGYAIGATGHAPHAPHAGWHGPHGDTRAFGASAASPWDTGTTGTGPHPGATTGSFARPPEGGAAGGGLPPTPPEAAFGMPAPGSGPKREPFFKRNKVLGVAAVTALATSLIVGPAAAIVTTRLLDGGGVSSLTGPPSGSASSGTVSTVAESTLPSVVSIQTSEGSGGSGVVISDDGQILTNNHVVAGANGPVLVQFNDGSEAEAEVLGADPVSDLAVIQASGVNGLTAASFGDSDRVEVGADVVAIGSPLGLSGTVTSGVVSAVDRPVNTGNAGQQPEQQDPLAPPDEGGQSSGLRTATVINAIQTDAPINPGNSGGPLMNMSGEVIGINTAILTAGQGAEAGSIGLGFAIPINQARTIAAQLIETGTAEYAAIDATISEPRQGTGATIVETSRGGAAAEAGLERGDVVTSIDGESVESPDALIAAVRSHEPGDTVTVGYTRDGNDAEVEITLSAQSAESIGG